MIVNIEPTFCVCSRKLHCFGLVDTDTDWKTRGLSDPAYIVLLLLKIGMVWHAAFGFPPAAFRIYIICIVCPKAISPYFSAWKLKCNVFDEDRQRSFEYMLMI